MSFSLSGSTITQSGTDANLSGLSGVSGVTIITEGGYTSYNLGDRKVVLNGNLTIDPEIEMLIVGATSSSAEMWDSNSGSKLTIGKAITLNGFTRYSIGTAIFFQDTSGGYTNRVSFNNNSELEWNGGVISVYSGKFGFYGDGCKVRINSLQAKLIYRTFDSQNQIRQETDDFISTAFDFYNGDFTIVGTGQQLNGYRTTHCTGGLAFSSATPNVDITLRDYAGRGNTKDVKCWAGNRPILLNPADGTNLFVGSHIASSNAYGTCRVYQELSIKVSEFNVGALSGAKVWFQDYDNGSRRIYDRESPSIDFRNDFTYSGESDSVGDIPLISVLTGSVLADTSYGSTNSATNTGLYAWDYRSKNNNTDDLFDMGFASYNHGLLALTDVPVKGVGGTVLPVTLFLDPLITQAVRATVDTYSTLDDSFEFYDRAKSNLCSNYAGQTTTFVTRSGSAIDAGAYNVSIDATASVGFAISGSTITIKADTFTGDMVTTGVISLLNGATFNGTRTDTNGTIAPLALLTVSVNQTGCDVVILAAGTQTVLASVDAQSGNNFIYSYNGSFNVDVGVIKQGFTVLYTYNFALTGIDATLPVNLLQDRNYQ